MPDNSDYVLYTRRYFMLILYSSLNFMQAFQWIQYSIITNIIVYYYGVTVNDVNWTSVICFLMMVPMMIPCTWLLESVGIRNYLIFGALLNFIATVIKCMSVNPTLFWVTLTGQAFSGLSTPFIQPLPPQVARTWFPNDQVSRATGFGVFAMYFGNMMSSLVPVFLVKNSHNKQEIATGLSRLFVGQAVFAAIQVILVVLFFEEKPQTAPSRAEACAYVARKNESYLQSMKRVLNKNVILIVLVYGLCGSESNSFLTVLNQMILTNFENEVNLVGITGFLSNGGSMMATFVLGYILDKYRCYKPLLFICNIISCCLFMVIAATIYVKSVVLLIAASTVLGFTINSYTTIVFNFASELTYPEPEGVASSLCVFNSQILSSLITFVVSALIKYFGVFTSNLFYVSILILAMILASFVKSDLGRERVESERRAILQSECDATVSQT